MMGKKDPKTYYEMYQENLRLRKTAAKSFAVYLIGVLILVFSLNMNIARIGNYILEKTDHIKVASKVIDPSSSNKYDPASPDGYYIYPSSTGTGGIVLRISDDYKNLIASGVCVDETMAVIGILKRHYTGFNRIKVAVSNNHVQAVRENIGGTLDYLKLDGVNVITGDFRSTSDIVAIISPDDFTSLADYYRPDLSYDDFKKFMAKKYGVQKGTH